MKLHNRSKHARKSTKESRTTLNPPLDFFVSEEGIFVLVFSMSSFSETVDDAAVFLLAIV